jgi:guanylate kinase
MSTTLSPMTAITRAGTVLIIVAPSGAGKTSLVRALLQERPGIRHSVSFTTRAPRPGEAEGVDYRFIDADEFDHRRAAGEFLEWAEVHGNLYGTSRLWIEEQTGHGADIVLEIDWQGARQVRALFPDAVSIFIAPPSLEVLRQRLTHRAKDSDAVIERRVAAARSELEHAAEFQYIIVNQDFTEACSQLLAITDAARCRYERQRARAPALFEALGM